MENISGVFSVLLSGASLASIQMIQTIHKLELYGRGVNGQLQIITINTEGSDGEGVPQILFTDINGYPMPQVIVQDISLVVHTVESTYNPSKAMYQPPGLAVESPINQQLPKPQYQPLEPSINQQLSKPQYQPLEPSINQQLSNSLYQPQQHEAMSVDQTINTDITDMTTYQAEPGDSDMQGVKSDHPELQKELTYGSKLMQNDNVSHVDNVCSELVGQPVTQAGNYVASDTAAPVTTAVTEATSSHGDKSLQELLMEMLTEPNKQVKGRKESAKKSNNEAAKLYNCSLCTKVFKKEASYQGHYQTHFGAKPFSCDQCSTGFTTKWALMNHLSLHTGVKPFDCEQCGKKFRRKYDLVVHQVKHTGEKHHKCEVCQEQFKYRSQLSTHRKYTHNGEVPDKPYKCSTCDKSFSNIWKCRIHERIHSDDRPYSCDVCEKAFRQSHHLKDHLTSVHDGIRPYSCTVCSRTFSQRHKMAQHMARHAIEKPFTCDVCSKSFRQQTNLDTHKLIHLRDTETQKARVKVRTKSKVKQDTSKNVSSNVKTELKKRINVRLKSHEVIKDEELSEDCSTNIAEVSATDCSIKNSKVSSGDCRVNEIEVATVDCSVNNTEVSSDCNINNKVVSADCSRNNTEVSSGDCSINKVEVLADWSVNNVMVLAADCSVNNAEKTKTDPQYLQTILESCNRDRLQGSTTEEKVFTAVANSGTSQAQDVCNIDHQSVDESQTTDVTILPQYGSTLPLNASTPSNIPVHPPTCVELPSSVDVQQSFRKHPVSSIITILPNYGPNTTAHANSSNDTALPEIVLHSHTELPSTCNLNIHQSSDAILPVSPSSFVELACSDASRQSTGHISPQGTVLPKYDSVLPAMTSTANDVVLPQSFIELTCSEDIPQLMDEPQVSEWAPG